jgi:phosphopantothenoylcysteine decarboxylase/phosphopantothenate--cysteine ligase
MKASPIRCLVTAGPTREFFDPVRFLSNPSSGKMGYAMAAEAARRGWETTLVSGPVSLPDPEGVAVTRVITGQQLFEAVDERFDACDILIMTAAIMDYRPKVVADHKIKKFELEMVIEMEPVVDVLATVSRRKRAQLVVGFAAETDHLETYGRHKLAAKNADFIVANLIGGDEGAFGRDDNQVLLIARDQPSRQLGPEAKTRLAARLLDIFQDHLPQAIRTGTCDQTAR